MATNIAPCAAACGRPTGPECFLVVDTRSEECLYVGQSTRTNMKRFFPTNAKHRKPDPPPFPAEGKTTEQTKAHEQSISPEPIKHLDHADAASESAKAEPSETFKKSETTLTAVAPEKTQVQPIKHVDNGEVASEWAKAEIPEAADQAGALAEASEQPETSGVPPDRKQAPVQTEIHEAVTTLEQQEMLVPAKSSQTSEAHVLMSALEPVERVELEGAREQTQAQLPAEVTEQAISTGETEAPVLDQAPDVTEASELEQIPEEIQTQAGVSEQAMPIGETEAPMQMGSSAIEQPHEETEAVEQTEVPVQTDGLVQMGASAQAPQQIEGNVQMQAADAVEQDQAPERTETPELKQVPQQTEAPEASVMNCSTETTESPQSAETCQQTGETVQMEAPVTADAVELDQAPERTETPKLEQALPQKESIAQLDAELAQASRATDTLVQGAAEQEEASKQTVAPIQEKTQEPTVAAEVDPGPQKATQKPRMPRSLSSLYLAPLRREAQYGVPTCDLQLRSFSLRGLEFYCDFALRAAYYLNLPAFGPVPLPRKIQRWTVPKSSFIFKKSQENFERITVRRLIQIRDGHPESVQAWLAFLQKHQYYGVGMKANVWEFSELNVGKHMDEKAKEVEALIEDKWELLGQHRDGPLNTVEKVEEFLQSERVRAAGGR